MKSAVLSLSKAFGEPYAGLEVPLFKSSDPSAEDADFLLCLGSGASRAGLRLSEGRAPQLFERKGAAWRPCGIASEAPGSS